MTELPSQPESDIIRERYAERWALNICRSPTFVQGIKTLGLATTLTIHTTKGQEVVIRASDVYAARKRFFDTLEIEYDICRMAEIGDRLVELFLDWLMHEYSDRYRHIQSDAQQRWLKQIITITLARHLMEAKYERYIETGAQTFVDSWAGAEMVRLQLLNSLPGQLAQLAHHIVRDPEQRQILIDHFYTELDVRMREHPLGIPDPLPPLASGATLPFGLISQRNETNNG